MIKKNTIKRSEPEKPSHQVLQYYEELRSYALGQSTAFIIPLGLDLFMKKGLKAWAIAWSEYSTTSATVKNSEVDIIPQAIQPEITILIANMILSRERVLDI
ncbi:MAG: hypothetical protein HPY74_19950 [Firmicutes bacterium]|nr:hypothetical protein [Bacillota bacterium]